MLSVDNMLNQDYKKTNPLKPLALSISHLLCDDEQVTKGTSMTTLPPMKSPSLSPSSSPSPIENYSFHFRQQEFLTTPPPLSPNHTFSSSSSTSSLSSYHYPYQQQQSSSSLSNQYQVRGSSSLPTSPSLKNNNQHVNKNTKLNNKKLIDNEIMNVLEKNKKNGVLILDDEDMDEMEEEDDEMDDQLSTTSSNSKSLKAKRRRANSKQLQILNQVFERTFFPSTQMRAELGRQLGMSPRTVQIWFQNKRQAMRTREKQRLLKLKEESD